MGNFRDIPVYPIEQDLTQVVELRANRVDKGTRHVHLSMCMDRYIRRRCVTGLVGSLSRVASCYKLQ